MGWPTLSRRWANASPTFNAMQHEHEIAWLHIELATRQLLSFQNSLYLENRVNTTLNCSSMGANKLHRSFLRSDSRDHVISVKSRRNYYQRRFGQLSYMMTSSLNGKIFRVTNPLCGEFTGHWWIPRKGQWRGALMLSLICAWINAWVNNREAVDYDVIVMWFMILPRTMVVCYLKKRKK